jgi:hypothetical protein
MKAKLIILGCIMIFLSCNFSVYAQIWNTVGDSTQVINFDSLHTGGKIFSIKNIDSLLYIAGGYHYIGNMRVDGIATWNGIKWDSIRSGLYGGCFDVCKFNNEIYLGGNGFVKFNGISWVNVGTDLVPNEVHVLKYMNKLFLGGSGFLLNSINIHNIASWDGSNYTELNGGLRGPFEEVSALAEYNNELIVGGDFNYAGSHIAFNIASWDGNDWKALDTGTTSRVNALAVDSINNFLYVGGGFNSVGGIHGINTYCVARWDGFQWDSLAGGLNYCDVQSLCMYRNKLFAGMCGPFTPVAPALANWDGKKWTEFDSINSVVYALGVYKDELYVGGAFNKIGQDSIFAIARYYEPPDTTCDYLQAILHPQNATFYNTDSVGVQFYNNIGLASSWLWDFGDEETDSIQKPLHYYHNSGVYPVSVIVHYQNCWDTASTIITVKPCDSLQAYIYTQNDTVYSSSSTVSVNFSSNPDVDNWEWHFSDDGSLSGRVVSHTYNYPGTYLVSVIVSQGDCSDTAWINMTIINTGISEEQKDETIYLWQNIPNPFDNTTSIPYYVPSGNIGTLQIVDETGKPIKEYKLLQGKNKLDISLSHLKSGVYYYSIFINGVKKQTLKMIVN